MPTTPRKQTDPPQGSTELAAPDDDRQSDESTGDTITLAVAHPYDSLVIHELDKLEITSDGTEVPADQEQAIRAAASDAGVRIRKVK